MSLAPLKNSSSGASSRSSVSAAASNEPVGDNGGVLDGVAPAGLAAELDAMVLSDAAVAAAQV